MGDDDPSYLEPHQPPQTADVEETPSHNSCNNNSTRNRTHILVPRSRGGNGSFPSHPPRSHLRLSAVSTSPPLDRASHPHHHHPAFMFASRRRSMCTKAESPSYFHVRAAAAASVLCASQQSATALVRRASCPPMRPCDKSCPVRKRFVTSSHFRRRDDVECRLVCPRTQLAHTRSSWG
jgi:hypothetical protein